MSAENSEKTMASLITNKDFILKILNLKSNEEVKEAFAKEGVEIADKEVDALGKALNNIFLVISKLDDKQLEKLKKLPKPIELSDLEKVSGGDGTNWVQPALSLFSFVSSCFRANQEVQISENNLQTAMVNLQIEKEKKERKKAGLDFKVGAVSSAKNLGTGALLLATVTGAMIIFKDDIRAWFRKKPNKNKQKPKK